MTTATKPTWRKRGPHPERREITCARCHRPQRRGMPPLRAIEDATGKRYTHEYCAPRRER